MLNKSIKYKETKEIIGDATLKLDGDSYIYDIEKLSKYISGYTGISENKLKFFIKSLGIKRFFDNPSLIGISKDEEILLMELKELLNIKEAYIYGTNTHRPI